MEGLGYRSNPEAHKEGSDLEPSGFDQHVSGDLFLR